MAGPLLDIVHDRGETFVQLAPLVGREPGSDRERKQRMHEAEAIAVKCHQPRLDRKP